MTPVPASDAPRRDKTFNVRLDVELYDAAMAKAEYGLSPVIRALLRAYVRGDVQISQADMLRELTSAPIVRVRRAASKRKAKK